MAHKSLIIMLTNLRVDAYFESKKRCRTRGKKFISSCQVRTLHLVLRSIDRTHFTATLEEHTHHKDGSAGSQCIACHMPQIETEGVPNTYVRSHTFRFITPQTTDRYGIPNPCTSCHKGKSTAWATDAMRRWPARSPWRIQ